MHHRWRRRGSGCHDLPGVQPGRLSLIDAKMVGCLGHLPDSGQPFPEEALFLEGE
jgi:hypothetical protein